MDTIDYEDQSPKFNKIHNQGLLESYKKPFRMTLSNPPIINTSKTPISHFDLLITH